MPPLDNLHGRLLDWGRVAYLLPFTDGESMQNTCSWGVFRVVLTGCIKPFTFFCLFSFEIDGREL